MLGPRLARGLFAGDYDRRVQLQEDLQYFQKIL
jgi:hypothetical protein